MPSQKKKFRFNYIPIKDIDVSDFNVRRTKRDEGLEELAQSIKEIGIQQPVVVYKEGDRFKLLIGQRRLLACQEIRLKEIPALIIDKKSSIEATILSFSENIHRTDLQTGKILRLPYTF